MSETSTPVTLEHFAYIAAHSAPRDDFLDALKSAADALGIPAISIAPEQAALFQILLKLGRAREVVEVGTLTGYSAICMARALPPGGRVRTIEISPSFADFAEAWIAKSDVADRIVVLRGDAAEILPTLATGSADAVFLDADKLNYQAYLAQALRILRSGGLLLADNAFAHDRLLDAAATDPVVVAVREFNEEMAHAAGLQAIIVPLGDGCWVGVKQ